MFVKVAAGRSSSFGAQSVGQLSNECYLGLGDSAATLTAFLIRLILSFDKAGKWRVSVW